ncbi:MAG: S8 family serine peptidase [Planctomycetota bacterium]
MCLASPATAGPDPAPSVHAPRQLRLRSGVVDTRLPSLPALASPVGGERVHYVVQLDGPPTPARRAQLEDAGVKLGDYLADHAYIVRLEGTTPQAVSRTRGVLWVDRFRPEWKLAPRGRLGRAGKVQVVVALFAGEDLAAAVAELGRLKDVDVLAANAAGDRGLIDAVVPLTALESIAALETVQFVEDAPLGTLRNTTTRWVVQSNIQDQTPLWAQGLHGEDQVAGLIDSEVWEAHCAFDDTEPVGPTHRKIIAYRGAMGAHSHGTHTAGTLVGDQGTWGAADPVDGMAFAAKLSFSLYWDVQNTPSLLYPDLVAAHADGARVHSNSWGDDSTTAYTTWCEQADRFSRDYEESLVIFAATNVSLLRTPENAKNVLAVGATYQAPSQADKYSGGRGPTADGRRKPEVFAPGRSIVSASYTLPCGTYTSSGTSMAAPAVAGMAVLARQYYTEGFYPTGVATPADALTPTGALLKATVINSAVDMTGVAGYPSNGEGWGRILLADTLYFAGDARKLFVADVLNTNGLSTGEFETYHLNVTTNGAPLKITLVFTDVPGTVNAQDPVVNNLDLIVTGPLTARSGGTEYLGNYFANGESSPGGAPDARNNVEQVHRSAPEPGIYTLEIRGTAVNQSTQGYALVAAGALEPTDPPLGNGDYDYDGDVDLADFAALQRCFTGADRSPIHTSCQPVDLDGDRDVDTADLAGFESVLSGP